MIKGYVDAYNAFGEKKFIDTAHKNNIPILIDGNSAETTAMLRQFAESWSGNVKVANDEERLKLHVAAVVACNFSNQFTFKINSRRILLPILG